MKILHLSSEKTWRGGEQQIAYLIKELQLQGITNLVACRKNSVFEEFCIKNSLSFLSLPFSNSLDLRTAAGIKAICKSESPDFIHLHSSKSHGIAVLSSWIGNPTPLILSRKVDFPLKRNWLSKKKYNSSQIKKIICVSNAVKEIVQKGIRDSEKAVTVYDGIDLNRFSKTKGTLLRERYSIPNDFYLIGNTAAIAPHKDYYTFVNTIELLEKVQFPAYYFIIGTGPLEEEIKAYVKEKNLQQRIIFTGFLNNINEILPELDLFLMTSKTEGLGSSILDAFACRVPVVSTSAGGIPEIVEHEKTGLLAPIGDHLALSNEVIRLFKHPGLRKELSERAHRKVQLFDKKIMAANTLKIYREVQNDLISNT